MIPFGDYKYIENGRQIKHACIFIVKFMHNTLAYHVSLFSVMVMTLNRSLLYCASI